MKHSLLPWMQNLDWTGYLFSRKIKKASEVLVPAVQNAQPWLQLAGSRFLWERVMQ